jgi:DNA-binding transcriptional LysR family regulator
LGQNIDIVAGLFDGAILQYRGCAALELSKEPICCAVSIHHRLAAKSKLTISDLFGENLMIIRRGWNSHVDLLRDDTLENYPQINVVDFPFYGVSVFNQCENSNDVLMAIEKGMLQNLVFDNNSFASHRAMAAILGVILKLPPVKQAMASKQLKSMYLDRLLSRKK